MAAVMANLPWVAVGWGIHLLGFGLVCYHSLRNRREGMSALLWIFIAWSFPLIGPLLYLMVGVDKIKDKGFRKAAIDRAFLAERRAREDETLPLAYWRTVHQAHRAAIPANAFGVDLDRAMNAILADHPLLGGNAITPLVTGDEAYPLMFEAMAQARHHIHVQSFIIGRDAVGRRLMQILMDRAAAGVRVRILYDRFGSTPAVLSGFFRRYRRHPNLQIVGWTQANPLKRQFQINLRNHRKILVVDGREAFMGGINLHRENITRTAAPAIRDYHFALKGPIVQELQYSFLRDWYFMTDEDAPELLQEVYFPHLDPAGQAQIRLVNSGPTSEIETLTDVLFMAIVSARKHILAVTPYFVPPQEILRALRAAALRGVRVDIVLPEQCNHLYVGLAGRALYDELMAAGVRLFERRPPFIHAKALIVDDTFALVGSANLDSRSLRLNYETDLAVYDDAFVNRLKAIVLDDRAQSREISLAEWRRRPVWRRLVENMSHLMQPVL